MITSKTLKIFVVALAIASVPAIVFAVPQLPHLFYGTVTINGSPASVGTVIIAKVGGVEKGRITTTTAGTYGGPGAYDQKLLVQGDITGGAQITFSVSGVAAVQTASFESGKVEQLNLSFTITVVTPTPTPSDGGSTTSGGGGGGGGGGGVTTPTTPTSPLSAAAQKVDTNKDNKIDVLDFNTLMVNWGKTTANNVADFNGDGKVDIFDFNLLMINWTK